MDEEKTIDEEKTVDEAVEEMTGEMKEFEPVAFDEAVKETEPERKDAPILRDAPDPADMNMIHKHVDNFLAKIAGETPIDENVRDSTEYWLKRIAENGGGGTTVIANPTLAGTEGALTGLQVGETKYKVNTETKLYMHIIRVRATNNANNEGLCSIITNYETEYTKDTFCAWLEEKGFEGPVTGSTKVLPATGIAYGTNPAGIVVGLYKRSNETQMIIEVALTDSGISRFVDPVFVSDSVIAIN